MACWQRLYSFEPQLLELNSTPFCFATLNVRVSMSGLVGLHLKVPAVCLSPTQVDMLPAGEEYMAYNKRRWGSDGWTVQLRRAGKPDGALFADWRTWPNTLQAHRLAWFADRAGKGSSMQDKLFEQIYEQGGNISDKATLAKVPP